MERKVTLSNYHPASSSPTFNDLRGVLPQDPYKKDVYTKHVIYPWRAAEQNQVDSAINHLKEEKFGMRSGMMIVRNLGQDRYVMYSFATHKKEHFPGFFYWLYYSKANHIARMGDFMYNELNPIINEYAQQENVHMPKIDFFKPIELEGAS